MELGVNGVYDDSDQGLDNGGRGGGVVLILHGVVMGLGWG